MDQCHYSTGYRSASQPYMQATSCRPPRAGHLVQATFGDIISGDGSSQEDCSIAGTLPILFGTPNQRIYQDKGSRPWV